MIKPIHTEQQAYKLIATACEFLKVTPSEIIGKSRQREYTTPRQLLWKFMHEQLDYSKTFIGVVFNKRDHTTIINGIRTANDWCDTDIYINSLYKCLEQHMSNTGYCSQPNYVPINFIKTS